jgi:hypothetical protein
VSNVCKSIFILAACLCCYATDVAAQGQYPLVFDSVNELKRYGLALVGIGSREKSSHFRTRCYYYGDGGWDISISEALLSVYKSQGFSRRSACLALVSGIRFNPETGERLATYIIVNRKMLRPKYNEPGAASEELPLSLPSCFNRGLPYSDCAWNYDPKTGRKLAANATVVDPATWKECLSHATTRKLCSRPWTAVEAGTRIEQFLSNPKNRCESKEVTSDNPEEELIRGAIKMEWKCRFEASLEPGPDDMEASRIAWNSAATLYDHSAEFPKGYGYALFASGEAGPDVPPEAVKAALNGKKPLAQVDASKLKKLWDTGTK